MALESAPLFEDIHPGPPGGRAVWTQTSDGKRIRLGLWAADAPKGTVLLFPGRTEYIEKYGESACELAARGYATLAIDWRGQGLADRLLPDYATGHVEKFPDYQKDIAAMVAAAKELDVPKPYFLMAHSMGGCIGLRALMEGLDVNAAAFTGPMWGIEISAALRPVAWLLGRLMPAIGQGHRIAPSTAPEPYVVANPFEDNTLTRDREMWNMMGAQITAHPELAIGGPSFIWLHEAIEETKALAARPAPDVPSIAFLGDNERIVRVDRIETRMANWSNGTLHLVKDGEHEVQMEGPEKRGEIFDQIAAHFDANRG